MSSADPASLLHKVVKVHSLSSRPELNNKLGTVTSFSAERNRYVVGIHPLSPHSPTISIRSENLTVASWKDKTQVQWEEYKNQAYALYRDPRARQQIQHMYSIIDRNLPKSPVHIRPEHLLIASLLVILLIIWLLGITKSILIFSLTSITVMVALEDIIRGLSQPSSGQTVSSSSAKALALFKTVLQNFPMRWRNVLAQTIGWPTISHRLALALWFLLVFFMGILLVSNPRKGQQYAKEKYSSLHTASKIPTKDLSSSHSMDLSLNPVSVHWTLEDVYKWGYDDASKRLDYGSSLPTNLNDYIIRNTKNTHEPSSNTVPHHTLMDDPYPLDYNYIPSSPPLSSRNRGRRPKLGYTTIAAFYPLFQVIRQHGFHDGKFDFPYFVANLKNLQPWRLALLGISLYKVA